MSLASHPARAFVVLLLCSLLAVPASAHETRLSFAPDRVAQHTALRQARDLVLFAQSELDLKLDWTDASVRAVEELAGSLHADVRRRRAAPGEIAPLVEMIGSYVGEVLRRNHGAEWGWVSVNGRRLLGLKIAPSGALFTPVETVRRRVHEGAASNLWLTYRSKAGL
ncbi:MAG: DUF3806 domain-containing protein [Gammaproteobacteria bacterium]